jgi:hypothetical protein
MDAAEGAVAMQQDEKVRYPRIAAGERLPDINGTNARTREIVAKG